MAARAIRSRVFVILVMLIVGVVASAFAANFTAAPVAALSPAPSCQVSSAVSGSPVSSSDTCTTALSGQVLTMTFTHASPPVAACPFQWISQPHPACVTYIDPTASFVGTNGKLSIVPPEMTCPFSAPGDPEPTQPSFLLPWFTYGGSSFTCTLTVDLSSLSTSATGLQVVEDDQVLGANTAATSYDQITTFAINFAAVTPPPPAGPPTASFAVTQDPVNANTWSFDATASKAGIGATITSYAWDFGDNSSGTGATVTHSFASGGTHTVTLTVTDNDLQKATASKTVRSSILVVNSAGDLPEVTPATADCDTGGLAAGGAPECTLRAAIQVANSDPNGPDTIDFAIPGSPVLTPASALPKITAPVTIDGTSEAGGWVTVDGTNAGNTPLISVTGGSTTITGLAVANTLDSAILLQDPGKDVISGDRFGVTAAGDAASDLVGVQVETSPGTTIGGATAGAGNDFVTTAAAVFLDGTGPDFSVVGNLIGTDPTGKTVLQQRTGSYGILAADTVDASAGFTVENNTIDNDNNAIVLVGALAPSPVIKDNRIGVASDGAPATGATGRGNYGIFVSAAPDPQITGNVIAGYALDIAVSGTREFGGSTNDPETAQLILLGPSDAQAGLSAATGISGTVSGNTLGVAEDGLTLANPNDGSEGIALYGEAAGETISNNAVEAFTGTGIGIDGGSGDTLSDNYVGVASNGQAIANNPASASLGIMISNTDKTVLNGNVVGSIFGTGIRLDADTHASVTNNLSGVVPGGATRPNKYGLQVAGVSTGTSIGPGNVLSGNLDYGITVSAAGVPVTGNYIGTDPTGGHAAGNYAGAEISNGTAAGAAGSVTGNVISSNTTAGLQLAYSTGVQVANNRIGLSALGATGLGNATGIEVLSGGINNIHDNTIAFNTTAGITEDGGGTTVRTNSIYSNPVGVNGAGASTLSGTVLQRASRVTANGVTRTWLIVPKLAGSTVEAFADTSCADPEGKTPLKLQPVLPGDGTAQIVTIIGQTTIEAYTVLITNSAGITSTFSNCDQPTVDADSDSDGIPDVVESAGPGGQDAAQNGQIANVPTDNGQFIQLRTNGGTLANVTPVTDPGTEPAGVSFPAGLVSFSITGLPAGSDVPVTVALPQSVGQATHYWRFGPPEPGAASVWYDWTYDGTTGAEPLVTNIDGTSYPGFVLHLVDGGRGDDDGIANGTIVDPGGPALAAGQAAPTPPLPLTSPSAPNAAAAASPTDSLADTGTGPSEAMIDVAVIALVLGVLLLVRRRIRAAVRGHRRGEMRSDMRR